MISLYFKSLGDLLYWDADTANLYSKAGKPVSTMLRLERAAIPEIHEEIAKQRQMFLKSCNLVVTIQETASILREETNQVRNLWRILRHRKLDSNEDVREDYAERLHDLRRKHQAIRRQKRRSHATFRTLMRYRTLLRKFKHDIELLSGD